jgi:hypothetical protein
MTSARTSSALRALRPQRLALVAALFGAVACENGASPSGNEGTSGGTAGAGTAGSVTGGSLATGGAMSRGGAGGSAGAGAGSPGGGTSGGSSGGGVAGSGGASSGAGGGGGDSGDGGHAGSSGTAGSGGAAGVAGAGGMGGGMGGSGASGMSGAGGSMGGGFPVNPVPVVLTDDAGYCWFEDPRALFHGERLIVGSVASGWSSAARRGDIEAVVYDFASSRASVFELKNQLELDDHDSAAFVARPDGKLLAVYAKHDGENRFYYRVSSSDTLLSWGAERTFTPSSATRVTYANLFLLTAENNRIYDFYRGLDGSFKPSYAYSDDGGESWRNGNVVIDVPSTERHRPYVRYASNGIDTVHFLYTEAHPRDFDNSLYHVYYRGGSLYRSNGTAIRSLTQGLSSPDEGTRIYQGNRDNVAWCSDLALDGSGRPVAAYSVQVGSGGLPTGQGGEDLRYRYARWDGSAFRDYALAYAGRRLYAGEDDYSGLVAIDPGDVNTVFISTNSNPSTGAPLMSAADGARHYEIFRGTTANGGQTWQWTPVTRDSRVDNLRPIVPRPGAGGRRALVWLRGTYRSYTDYQQELVAVFWSG